MTISNAPYTVRASTKAKTAQVQSRPFEGNGRKILPIEHTPSITVTSEERKVDKQVSGVKAELRIHTYFINAQAEKVLGAPFERGKTAHQGARAPKGWQAAHASLAPKTNDTFTLETINRVVANGLSPRKSKPFLESRIGLTPADEALLQNNHSDPEYVQDFILSRLPVDAQHSVLEGTRYYWHCNSTFDNPDESNQYDSQMERTLSPFLEELQEKRLKGELSPEASTEDLVVWLMNYYDSSSANLKKRLQEIEDFSLSFQKLRKFELANLTVEKIPAANFQEYLTEVDRFLTLYNSLSEEQKGCPTTSAFSDCRNDFKFLKKLKKEGTQKFFLENRRHLASDMQFNKDHFVQKFTLYLQEAEAQKISVEAFTAPCAIPNLSKNLFGIYENGVRRAPNDAELRTQIFGLFKLATPVKEKMAKKRPLENKENAVQANPKKPRSLNFE